MAKSKITGFLGVFEDKLTRLIKKIKDEYDKPKADRNRANLKSFAREAKSLKKLVNELQEQTVGTCKCPACGHNFKPK